MLYDSIYLKLIKLEVDCIQGGYEGGIVWEGVERTFCVWKVLYLLGVWVTLLCIHQHVSNNILKIYIFLCK